MIYREKEEEDVKDVSTDKRKINISKSFPTSF